jgi:hypothetical protein
MEGTIPEFQMASDSDQHEIKIDLLDPTYQIFDDPYANLIPVNQIYNEQYSNSTMTNQVSMDQYLNPISTNPVSEDQYSISTNQTTEDQFLNSISTNHITDDQFLNSISTNQISDYHLDNSTRNFHISMDSQITLDHPNAQSQLISDQQKMLDDLLNLFPTPSQDINPFTLHSNESNLVDVFLTLDTPSIENSTRNLCETLTNTCDLQSLINYLDIHKNDKILDSPSIDIMPTKSTRKRKLTNNSASGSDQDQHMDHSYSILVEKKTKFEVNKLGDDEEEEDDDDSVSCSSMLSSSFGPHVKRGTVKYFERRKKNNVASKRSRETRKSKFMQMEEQADILEKQNEELRKKIAMLEKATIQMKDVLVAKLKVAK